MKATTPKQVLQATKWILDHHDWTQGTSFRDRDGHLIVIVHPEKNDPNLTRVKSFCVIGAISCVQADSFIKEEAIRLLRTVSKHSSLLGYNDTPGRTKGEIMAVIQRAIDIQGALDSVHE